jgi:amino acid transporter
MELVTSRPRVLGWLRSAAILDGDWGTSVAYVLGLAFYHAGYFSSWHLMLMLMLTALIAFNYTTICRLYPGGGGVYASVSHRSRPLAVIGALLLSADYVVTVSLSVLDGCHYLNLPAPQVCAIFLILTIGVLNFFGPRHAGSVAIVISSATLFFLLILAIKVLPVATSHIAFHPSPTGLKDNWTIFVSIILSISGIEAISNMTGLMKNPTRDSRKAIFAVLAKISIVTMVLGLAMNAIPNLDRTAHQDNMIRFIGEHYIGNWYGYFIGAALGFLLISAGNTAINALVSLQYMMSVDGELPRGLRRLNKFGVPFFPLLIATSIPIIVLLIISDVLTLSSLYAIGVVGAVLINIGSTGTDRSIKLAWWIRLFMMCSAVVLFFIEATIAVEKTKALIFALTVLAFGLGARELGKRQSVVQQMTRAAQAVSAAVLPKTEAAFTAVGKMMVAVRGGAQNLLVLACQDAKLRNAFLFIIQVKPISVGILPDRVPSETSNNIEWIDNICREYKIPYRIINILSPEVGYTIAEQAATLGIDRLILGAPQRSLVEKALRGDIIREVSQLLPEEIQLVIYRS